jgi:hypothetical protein
VWIRANGSNPAHGKTIRKAVAMQSAEVFALPVLGKKVPFSDQITLRKPWWLRTSVYVRPKTGYAPLRWLRYSTSSPNSKCAGLAILVVDAPRLRQAYVAARLFGMTNLFAASDNEPQRRWCSLAFVGVRCCSLLGGDGPGRTRPTRT